MRKNRVVEQNRCYHLVSRLAHRAFFLNDEETGWRQTPRNARFSGLSAMSTTRMTSESGSGHATRLFPGELRNRRGIGANPPR